MAKEMIAYKPEIGLSKEVILNNFFDEDGRVIPARTNERFLKKYGFYEPLIERYSDSKSIMETLHRIVNDIEIRPVCKICGAEVTFNKITYFSTYCSRKCQNGDPEMKIINANSVSKALKEKYNEHGDEIISKRKKTLQEKYNVDSPFKVSDEKKENTLYKDITDMLIYNGISDEEFVCDVRNMHRKMNVDIFFINKKKLVILNTKYIFTDADKNRNEIIKQYSEKYGYKYIYIVKDMLYTDKERFRNILLHFYNDSLYIENPDELVV